MPNPPEKGSREPEAAKLVTIPQMPDLLEASGLKRIGPARIRQLALEDEAWPSPVFQDGRTRIFDWRSVEAYFRNRTLRQGQRTDKAQPPQEDRTDHGDGSDPTG